MEEQATQEQLEERAHKAKADFVEGWIVALQQRKDALLLDKYGPERLNQFRTLDYCQDILFEYLDFLKEDEFLSPPTAGEILDWIESMKGLNPGMLGPEDDKIE